MLCLLYFINLLEIAVRVVARVVLETDVARRELADVMTKVGGRCEISRFFASCNARTTEP